MLWVVILSTISSKCIPNIYIFAIIKKRKSGKQKHALVAITKLPYSDSQMCPMSYQICSMEVSIVDRLKSENNTLYIVLIAVYMVRALFLFLFIYLLFTTHDTFMTSRLEQQ